MKLTPFIAILLVAEVAGRGADNSWTNIGKSLENWDSAAGLWRIEDGIIIGETTGDKPLKHHSYLIWRGGVVKDFELKLQFRAPGIHNNSGVQYRSRDLGDHQVAGYQCNIHPRVPGSTGVLEEMKNGRGGHLADIGEQIHLFDTDIRIKLSEITDPQVINESLKKHDWNNLTIRAKGRRLRHWLNGHLAVDVIDEDSKKAASEGVLALQLHSGRPMRIEFRNLRLRVLHKHSPETEGIRLRQR